MKQALRFEGINRTDFHSTVRSRVNEYFKKNNIPKHANAEMYFKAVLFLGGLVVFYTLIMSNLLNIWVMLGLAIMMGVFKAFIGFNVAHDAIHGSYFKSKRANRLMSYSFDLVGASSYMWSIMHNIVHHTYTNIPGHDEDIEFAPGLVRISAEDPLKGFMKYQHWYAFPLYGFASINWVFKKDYVKFFSKKIGEHPVPKHTAKDYFNLFFFKFVYYTLFIILPLVFLDITWWQFVIGFVAMHFAEGLVLGLVFQLAHVVEGMQFPEPNPVTGNIEDGWAEHQMRTTANFATNSFWANFLCGGLNMQIEHHLFPNICHTHYRYLAPIVEETAKEFNLPYINNKTFFSALQSHARMLKMLGKEALENKNAKQFA